MARHLAERAAKSPRLLVLDYEDSTLGPRLLRNRRRIETFDAKTGVITLSEAALTAPKRRRWWIWSPVLLAPLLAFAISQPSSASNPVLRCEEPVIGQKLATNLRKVSEHKLGGLNQVLVANDCEQRFKVSIAANTRVVVAIRTG